MGDVNHEPTMEEILASIKRIIAEDGEAALAERRARRREAAPTEEPPAEDVLELTDTVEAEARAEPEPEPAPPEAEAIVSDAAAAASRAALAALAAISKTPEPHEEAAGGQALEAVVRDMLRPMLKEWLDANLPGLVEEMVAREIARIAGARE